jgi:hypothetical protein
MLKAAAMWVWMHVSDRFFPHKNQHHDRTQKYFDLLLKYKKQDWFRQEAGLANPIESTANAQGCIL